MTNAQLFGFSWGSSTLKEVETVGELLSTFADLRTARDEQRGVLPPDPRPTNFKSFAERYAKRPTVEELVSQIDRAPGIDELQILQTLQDPDEPFPRWLVLRRADLCAQLNDVNAATVDGMSLIEFAASLRERGVGGFAAYVSGKSSPDGELTGLQEGKGGNRARPIYAKRSTANDTIYKITSALTKHHQYADGGCMNEEPISVTRLATSADVAKSTVSKFFKDRFNDGKPGGYVKYRAVCGDRRKLIAALKLLNGEFAPSILFGRNPRGDDLDEE